eukprot:TRINITY_DN89082_c1_g1_i1.p1 TRINITY_DN89082_c1_g1~~TRINITY_DN89082_c1_g1_i1.p1  ORF type:complete len:362 (+),score=33.92 TRINITY_DN89082_c1_g1_i1:94-1086(+)
MRRICVVTLVAWIMLAMEGVEGHKILKDVPVIGIVSKPLENETHEIKTNLTQVIDATYVNYLHAAGAKPVQISHKLPEDELRSLMRKINGVLFTGGGTDFVFYDDKSKQYYWTPFGKSAKSIIDIAIEMNDEGIYFPVWGTCMGFQALAFVLSQNPKIPKYGCNCVHYNAKLLFTSAAKTSRLFSIFSPDQMKDFSEKGLTYNSHHYYVDYLDFLENKPLMDFFDILAYSLDKDETFAFITAMEAKKYPIYGTQFHPELRPYNVEDRIPGPENTKLAQTFGNFFVNEARKNANNMDRSEELERTIWRVPLIFDKKDGFIYLFPQRMGVNY